MDYKKFKKAKNRAKNIIKKDARDTFIEILQQATETPAEQYKRIQERRKESKANQQKRIRENQILEKHKLFRARKDSMRR